MNTRRALPGSPFRQERFASSHGSPGLRPNLVAVGLSEIRDTALRRVVWWLQAKSWERGGLDLVAEELAGRFQIRAAQPWSDPMLREIEEEECDSGCPAQRVPSGMSIEQARDDLLKACLDPSNSQLRKLEQPLSALIREDSEKAMGRVASTSLSRAMFEALKRCQAIGRTVLVEGWYRTGKTTAAKAWCAASAGLARYVPTPPGNDLDALFRSIAGALGSAAGDSYKAKQVEERILKSLDRTGLMLVFDDAWHLWPQGDTRQSHPRRLNWIARLMDTGIPIALITSPQWWESRRFYIAETQWAVEQLEGRLAGVTQLPAELTEEDCLNVARILAPQAGAECWKILGLAARASRRGLGALETLLAEARMTSESSGRESPIAADFRMAASRVLETDSILAAQSIGLNRPTPAREGSIRPQHGRSAAEDRRDEGFGRKEPGRGVDSPVLSGRMA